MFNWKVTSKKKREEEQKKVSSKKSESSVKNVAKTVASAVNRDQLAYDTWKEDKERRNKGFIPNSKDGASFKEASRPIQYNSKIYANRERNSSGKKWRKEIADELGKDAGKKFDDRIKNSLKQNHGMSDSETEEFMKYMDARELDAELGGSEYARLEETKSREDFKVNNVKQIDLAIKASQRESEKIAENKAKTETAPSEKPQDTDRGFLDRTFDMLLTGQYVSANLAKSALDGKGGYTAKGAVLDGLRAGNPTGGGYEAGEASYSDVLRQIETKYGNERSEKIRETTVGRIALGTAGLVGDILLDPTTYATFGISAVAKGAGRLGSVGSSLSKSLSKEYGVKAVKSSDEIATIADDLYTKVREKTANEMQGHATQLIDSTARATTDSLVQSLKLGFDGLDVATASNIVSKQSAKGGVTRTAEQITKDAETLARKYNQLLGYTRQGKIGLSLGNLPFADKIVGQKLASKTLGFSDATVRKISDKLAISAPYTKLRNGLYSMKAVSHLSPTSVMFKMAKESPEKLYQIVNLSEATRALKGGTIVAEKSVREFSKVLSDLSPSQQKEVREIMQDASKWQPIVKQLRLAETVEGKAFAQALEATKVEEYQKLSDLRNLRSSIDEMRTYQDNDLFDMKTQLDAIEKDYAEQIKDIDLELFKGTAAYDEALEIINAERKKLQDDFMNMSSDLMKKEVELPALPQRPVLKDMESGKPVEPTLATKPDQPALEEVPKRESFHRNEDTDQRDYLYNEWVNYKGLAYGTEPKREYINNLNKFLGNDVKIAKVTYDYEIDRIVKQIQEGVSKQEIASYIKANSYRFDGRAYEIYSFTAERIGYGSGTKFKNWDEYYTKRIADIDSKRGTEKFTPQLQRLYDKLNKDALIRSQMIAELKGKTLKQIMQRKKEFADAELMKLHDAEADRFFSETTMRAVGRDPMPEGVADAGRGIERVGTSSGQDVAYQATKSGGNRAVDVGVGNGAVREDVYNYKLISSEVEEVKAYVFKTANKLESTAILNQGGIAGFANRVATETENVLASTFKREWSNLTPKQRTFAVTLASKNVLEGAPDLAKSAHIKKFAKHIEERMIQRHAEAVNSASKIGDKVLMRESDLVGVIENKQYYPDGLVEYNVRFADGTTEVVTTASIKEINSAKPADILFSQIVKDSIDESYVKAVKEIEERNQQKLFEYAQTVKQIDDDNAKAMEAYQKRLDEWQAKRDADYAEAMEKYNKEYPAILEERRRIKALNESTREQYEEAMRTSSKVADEYFERSKQLEEFISASKEVGSTNSVRGVALDQVGRVREANKNGLLDSMREAEKQSDKITKYLNGEGQLETMVKTIDDKIAKVNEDLAKLRSQEPVDMEDLIQREDNLFRQIQERQKKVKVDRYSDEKLSSVRLNSATPNKNGKLERTPEELKVLDEIKDLEKRMKDVQAEISVARTSMLKENWNEEMSRLITTKNHLEEERKLFDGSTDITKLMDDLEKDIHEIDRILGNDDLLDAYIKERVAPEQIAKWYEDFSNNRVLDEVSFETGNQYSAHVIDVAKQLRRNFINMGMKEVEIGRLKAGQFDEMLDQYLPHVLSPAGRKFLRSREGRNVSEQGGLPFGFYNTDNPFAKARTLKTITFEDGTVVNNPTIEQINRYFKEKHGVEQFFQESLPDIFLSRALKHNELVYSDDYMQNIMTMFGTRVTRDNVDEFDSFQVNIAQLREYVQSKVSQQISFAQSSGIVRPSMNYSEDMLEAVRNDIMKGIHIDPRVIKEDVVPMLTLNKKQAKALLDEGQDWVHSVPKEIVMKANQARMVSIQRDHNRLLQMYDKFLHWTKLMQTVISPSFHMRNKMSNMFNSWLSVGGRVNSPQHQKAMFDVIHHKGDYSKLKHLEPMIINKPDGTQELMAWSNVYDTARKYGVIDEGYFAQEFGTAVGKARGDKTWNPFDSNNFYLFRGGTKVGSYNENMDRLAQFSAHLADGKTADEAKELVDKYLFDYSDLTLFEQRVMKRIFPYYTFWRKNTSLQLRSIMENPHKMALSAKVMNAPEGMLEDEEKVERQYISDFAKSWVQIPAWSKGTNAFTGVDEEEPILLNPALPFMELDRIPNPFEIDEAFMGTMAMTAPLIKNPFEIATNKSTFFNSPLTPKVKTENDEGETVYEKAGLGQRSLDATKHVLMQTAPSVQIEGAINKDGTDKALHMLNALTGVKMLSYNYGTAKSIELNKQAYEGGYMDEWQRDSYEKYQESRRVPFDKVLDFAKENLNLVEQHGKLSEKYFIEAGKLAGTLDRWTKGESLTSEDKKYQPFIDVMERVGKKFGKSENETRDFVGATLDKSGLDGIVLGKDFTTLKVNDVLDGDTFEVDYKGKKRSVRLLLVDTPETSKRFGQQDMAFGKEAFKFTSDMIKDRDVEMVIDSRGTDAYGRLLAYVYVDGKLLQGSLIEEGLGNLAYTDMDDSKRNNYREDLLRTLRDKAKTNQKGVHSISGYAGNDGSYDNSSYMTEEELKRYYGN